MGDQAGAGCCWGWHWGRRPFRGPGHSEVGAEPRMNLPQALGPMMDTVLEAAVGCPSPARWEAGWTPSFRLPCHSDGGCPPHSPSLWVPLVAVTVSTTGLLLFPSVSQFLARLSFLPPLSSCLTLGSLGFQEADDNLQHFRAWVVSFSFLSPLATMSKRHTGARGYVRAS